MKYFSLSIRLFLGLYLSISALYSVFPGIAEAHEADKPLVYINGEAVIQFPAGQYADQMYGVPEDQAKNTYSIDQIIRFELKTSNLTKTKIDLKSNSWRWDFGDQTESTGLTSSHSYSKKASYIVRLLSTNPNKAIKKEFEVASILLHVTSPTVESPPQAVMLINKTLAPKTAGLMSKASFLEPLRFAGGNSKAGTGKNLSYTWTIAGKEYKGSSQTVSLASTPPRLYALAILKVEDENGFFDYQATWIHNEQDQYATIKKSPLNQPFLIGLSITIVLLIILFKTHHKKHRAKRHYHHHHHAGFTIIELLIVIAIIAILASLIILNFSGATMKARNASAQVLVGQLGKSVELYRNTYEQTLGVQNPIEDVCTTPFHYYLEGFCDPHYHTNTMSQEQDNFLGNLFSTEMAKGNPEAYYDTTLTPNKIPKDITIHYITKEYSISSDGSPHQPVEPQGYAILTELLPLQQWANHSYYWVVNGQQGTGYDLIEPDPGTGSNVGR